jgi:ABC-type lipoprotein export system ATPase subunit
VILQIDSIVKRYQRGGRELVALDDVSLEVGRGEMVGLFGASGAGKTTLLRIAAGLEAPDSGTVSYKGRRLDEMSNAERRRLWRSEIACVWGTAAWPSGLSVMEYTRLPLLVDGWSRREAERRARETLLACDADHLVDADPAGLSEGERQRIGVARALVVEPRLVLADGAISNLSIVEQEEIAVLLESLAREAKVALLVADSGYGAMLGADPAFYLREGKLVGPDASRAPAEVIPMLGRARADRATDPDRHAGRGSQER